MMVKTRGGSPQTDRVKPTALVRRRGCDGGDTIPKVVEVEENVVEEVNVVKDERYRGGPMDRLLLLSYENHIARQLWDGVVSSSLWLN